MLNRNGKMALKINNSNNRASATYKTTLGNSYSAGTGTVMQYLKLYVGSGTTEATVDDYALENEEENLTLVASSGTNDSSAATWDQNYIGVFSATFKNDTDADIVVSEIGLTAKLGGTPSNDIMIARDTFSPVTIAPQATYTFSMTIG